MVRVRALSSGRRRFEPWSLQVVIATGGICSPCKIVYDDYDRWYKNGQKSLSGHILDTLSVVSIRVEPHKGYATERMRSSAA